jgi:hypothetical protein
MVQKIFEIIEMANKTLKNQAFIGQKPSILAIFR